MQKILRVLVVLAGLFLLGAQAQPDTWFDLRVPVAPMVRSVEGVNEVVYELHLDKHTQVMRSAMPAALTVVRWSR